MSKAMDEMPQVNTVEGAMDKALGAVQFRGRGVPYEIMRCFVHELHQSLRIIDDGDTLSPSNGGRKETDHFSIFTATEGTRDLDRIRSIEGGLCETVVCLIQDFLQIDPLDHAHFPNGIIGISMTS